MYLRLAFIASVATASLAAPAAQATTTVVEGGTRGLQLLEYGPVGQSFTPTEARLLSFGFQFQTVNATITNSPVTLTLLAGAGLTGATIATRTATLAATAARTSFWYDFDLSGTTLNAGTAYTALLSTGSTRLALLYGPALTATGPDAYTGGSLVSTKAQTGYCLTGPCDANFRFTTAAAVAAVPEPATWTMMLAGFAMVGGAVRYRRRAVRLAYR